MVALCREEWETKDFDLSNGALHVQGFCVEYVKKNPFTAGKCMYTCHILCQ